MKIYFMFHFLKNVATGNFKIYINICVSYHLLLDNIDLEGDL